MIRILIFAFICIATPVFAQTPSAGTNAEQPLPKLDPRMPAVIPGQSVHVGGDDIKVWSTGGNPSEVLGNESIEAPKAPIATETPNSIRGDLSVILDRRGTPASRLGTAR